jgi:hypothetical protein
LATSTTFSVSATKTTLRKSKTKKGIAETLSSEFHLRRIIRSILKQYFVAKSDNRPTTDATSAAEDANLDNPGDNENPSSEAKTATAAETSKENYPTTSRKISEYLNTNIERSTRSTSTFLSANLSSLKTDEITTTNSLTTKNFSSTFDSTQKTALEKESPIVDYVTLT